MDGGWYSALVFKTNFCLGFVLFPNPNNFGNSQDLHPNEERIHYVQIQKRK